eukprot:c26575_g1_i1 orf=538-2418(+)
MSFSTGGAPKVECEADQISPAVLKMCRLCTPRKTCCVPSPVDPGTWEGASSLARFGLDIGGTLCKVVYFEPFCELAPNTNVGQKIEKVADASHKVETVVSTKGANQEGQGLQSASHNRQQQLIKIQDKMCILTENKDSVSVSAATELDNKVTLSTAQSFVLRNGVETSHNYGDKMNPDKAETLVMCQCKMNPSSKGDAIHSESASINARLGNLMGEVVKGDQGHPFQELSLDQGLKLWISSHEPVHLPCCGTLYFKCFETWRMEEFLLLAKQHSLFARGRTLGATGGGARKFGHHFLEIAGLHLHRADEIKSLVRGIDFLVKHAQYEILEYPRGSFKGGAIQRPLKAPDISSDANDNWVLEEESSSSSSVTEEQYESSIHCKASLFVKPPEQDVADNSSIKPKSTMTLSGPVLSEETGGWLGGREGLGPYLIVNIGSGVGILRVDSPDQFERVGGTSLGGSTFFGLVAVLAGCSSFEEAIQLAAQGDSTEIDMLVGDIYGGDYSEMGLAATTVASSFGKLVHPSRRAAAKQTPQQLAKAALLMVTNNISSLAMLHARATGVDRVMFTGSFLHGNELAMRVLAVAMEFWSKGQIKAIFLRHEGHAGAVGALLNALSSCDPIDALLLS